MVQFYTSTAVNPPAVIYMGKDKEENEDLIRYGWPQDVWFHVDKLSSAHVYLRLPPTIESWEKIPQELLVDCAQLVKYEMRVGNKKDNLTIIYTPWDNLKKTGDMAVGQVSFHRNDRSPLVHVSERVNAIVNRLNKTKVVRDVDHEQERVDRIKAESAKRKAAAIEKKKADAEQAKQREAEKEARSYDNLFTGVEDEDEDEDGSKEKKKGIALEDDFM
ncbi:coiled-coil domain-containing protein [Ceratobasidium sp. AG-Ba]|nr:coiled-coil domain-containing protein [Ceratobasidium sp. AG-Ba]